MSDPTKVTDGTGKGRQLTNAEKVLFGLAKANKEPLYSCSTHPIFIGKGGLCPTCGRPGTRFATEKGAAA
jgi:hypothetical protein